MTQQAEHAKTIALKSFDPRLASCCFCDVHILKYRMFLRALGIIAQSF